MEKVLAFGKQVNFTYMQEPFNKKDGYHVPMKYPFFQFNISSGSIQIFLSFFAI